MLKVIALDLEGTLISNAMSQILQLHLFSFLENCYLLCDRILMFTIVNENKFRQFANLLVVVGSAPSWFNETEYIDWEVKTRNLAFISGVQPHEVLLVDDQIEYVHLI